MANIQTLSGAKVTAKGSPIANRFVNQTWGYSEAFGGWIYGVEANINFSQSPSELKLKLVNSNVGVPNPVNNATIQNYQSATYDIEKTDLNIYSPDNSQSSDPTFDIQIGSSIFKDYILYDFQLDANPDQKFLNLTFKDYSIILDKIYVGIHKRQAYEYDHKATLSGEFEMNCPDCNFTGGNFVFKSGLSRDVSFGYYAYANGKKKDFLSSIVTPNQKNLSYYLNRLCSLPATNGDEEVDFNLNGGYLFLGAEEFPEENCGDLPEVKHSFPELLACLRNNGLKVGGAFTGFTGNDIKSRYFRQNYNGPLRDVLSQWCSDYALDFYMSGKSLIGVDLKNPVDISKIKDIIDPSTQIGSNFGPCSKEGISSYSINYSMDNTYDQSVITADVRAKRIDTRTKTTKRHVGILPMHPLSWSEFNFSDQVFRQNSHNITGGTNFGANQFYYDWFINGNELTKRYEAWTERYLADIDISIALSKYDETLRNIWNGQKVMRAIDALAYTFSYDWNTYTYPLIQLANADVINNTIKTLYSQMKAFGFYPVYKVQDIDIKSDILSKFKGGGDDTQEQNLDQQYFEIFIGRYNPEEHRELIEWEKTCAENMYRQGILVQGPLNTPPFTPSGYFERLSPTGGLFDGEGVESRTFKHEFAPDTKQHFNFEDAPYKELVPFSKTYATGHLTGVYVAKDIGNVWGTTTEEFDSGVSDFLLDTRCRNTFNSSALNYYQQGIEGIREQTWNMEWFAPSFHREVEDFYEDFEHVFERLALTSSNTDSLDNLGQIYYNKDGEARAACGEFYFCIIPRTDDTDVYSTALPNGIPPVHPNGKFEFDPHGFQLVSNNKEMKKSLLDKIEEDKKQKALEREESYCEINLVQEFQKSGLLVNSAQDPSDERFSCTYDEENVLSPGFHEEYITGDEKNCRRLTINIHRNLDLDVDKMVPSDVNGDYYVEDLLDNETLNTLPRKSVSLYIDYPIQTSTSLNPDHQRSYAQTGHLYYGIQTTTATTEKRSPESIEIIGEYLSTNKASKIKVIDNQLDPSLNPYLNATQGFLSTQTLITDDEELQSITGIRDYHNAIVGLNNYSQTNPTEEISFSIIGEGTGLTQFAQDIISPQSGLTSFRISLSENGFNTDVIYASRPPILPKQETILNSIKARIK